MARRKLEYHNWRTERDRDNNEKHLNNINMERFHKNRVRRLLKEQEEKQKKDVHEKKENDISLQSDSKCSKCHQELLPPYQLYVCHKNHLHKERGSTSQNKDLQVGIILIRSLLSFIPNCVLYFSTAQNVLDHQNVNYNSRRL